MGLVDVLRNVIITDLNISEEQAQRLSLKLGKLSNEFLGELAGVTAKHVDKSKELIDEFVKEEGIEGDPTSAYRGALHTLLCPIAIVLVTVSHDVGESLPQFAHHMLKHWEAERKANAREERNKIAEVLVETILGKRLDKAAKAHSEGN